MRSWITWLALISCTAPVLCIDPCDGAHPIRESDWFLTCPANSHVCGGWLGHWPACCCDEGYIWDIAKAGVYEGLETCQQCGPNSQTDLEDPRLSPSQWLRRRLGWYLRFIWAPPLLRFLSLLLLDKALARLTGFSVKRLLSGLRKGVADPLARRHTRPLRPGARAYVWRVQQDPAVLDLDSKTIAAHHQHLATGALDHGTPSAIRLVAPDVRWMGFRQYGLALGYTEALIWVSAGLHLVLWHLLQLVMGPLVFFCFCDLLDPYQKFFAALHCLLRVPPYCAGLILAGLRRPAFLLYHPEAALALQSSWALRLDCLSKPCPQQPNTETLNWAKTTLDLCSYALQPEIWVLKIAFIHQVEKPRSYCLLLTVALLADIAAMPALFAGLPGPLCCLYLVVLASLLLSALAQWWVNFFREATESVRVEEARALRREDLKAAALREAGFTAGALRAAGFAAEELCEAGFGEQDIQQAGLTEAELRDACWHLAYARLAAQTQEQTQRQTQRQTQTQSQTQTQTQRQTHTQTQTQRQSQTQTQTHTQTQRQSQSQIQRQTQTQSQKPGSPSLSLVGRGPGCCDYNDKSMGKEKERESKNKIKIKKTGKLTM